MEGAATVDEEAAAKLDLELIIDGFGALISRVGDEAVALSWV